MLRRNPFKGRGRKVYADSSNVLDPRRLTAGGVVNWLLRSPMDPEAHAVRLARAAALMRISGANRVALIGCSDMIIDQGAGACSNFFSTIHRVWAYRFQYRSRDG